MLRLPTDVYEQMVAHCLAGLPEEGCGLLAAPPGTADVVVCYPTGNVEASARLYRVDPLQHLKADQDAEARDLEIVGVFHSHTHTEAYPSPTDVAQAPDPGWHYVLVSLKEPEPVVRSFRIVDGEVTEEPVAVGGG
ncbi:MAG: M67 family metallopeptidase [Actinomycetota bacterium]|nr:M67 family metallopeptidase [Actinomycetota bacterium]PLS76459.1 MAG: peptidase [Actinomycetota bacterium]